MRRLVLLIAGALAVGMVIPATAEAATGSYGVSVSLPSSRTVYNHGKVSVAPSVHVKSGVHKSVTRKTVLVYKNGHRVAAGAKVRLRIGTYKAQARVTYRAYHYVTKHRTVQVYHPSDTPPGSTCKILRTSDTDGDGTQDAIADAVCTNPARPGQSRHVDGDPLWDVYQPEYTVGSSVTSDDVTYADYYQSVSQAYQARVWDGYHTFTSRRKALTVKDGGHQRVYSYRESHNTPFFTVPRHWIASYAFDCSNYGYSGNWIVDLHRKGSSVLYDKNLRNQIRYRGTGGWHFTGAGTYRFKVITECAWAVVVRWR